MITPVVLECGCLIFAGMTIRGCADQKELWKALSEAETSRRAQTLYRQIKAHEQRPEAA